MVEVARRLERDSVIAGSLLSRSVENIVGTGYRLQSQAKGGERAKQWNAKAEGLWKDWSSNPSNCDVRGLSTINDLLRLTCRARLRDGDQGTILLSDGKIQQAESDQIVSPSRASTPSKNMVDGVELDRRGRPQAFWVVDDPDPMLATVRFSNAITRIGRESFVFTARRERHGQTRGLPPLAKIAWLIEQIDGNIEAVTVASRMAACVGLVIQRKQRANGLPRDEDGRRKLKLQPGFVAELGLEDKVTQVQQTQPGTDWPDYLAALFRLAALEFGLPLEIGFLDVSRANYTNLRAACNQAKRTWSIEQQDLMLWESTIYRWKVLNWIRQGKLPERRDAFSHEWITDGWAWVDPEKEISAMLAGVDAGIDTKTRIARMKGLDLEEIAQKRSEEIKLFETLDIPEVNSKMTRVAGGAAAAQAESAAPAKPAKPAKPGK
jgi:lambda family phage portal protein